MLEIMENYKVKKNEPRNNKLVFKEYNQDQTVVLNFGEMIPDDDVVKVISSIVDGITIDDIINTYKPGGTSSYHPRMLIKVLVYAYTQSIYSSRKIDKALHRDIHFMWLAGMNTPDFRTISDFRSSKLKDKFEKIFSDVVLELGERGYIDLEMVFQDGTKIEANANRYTFVWKGSIEKYKEKIEEKVGKLMKEVEETDSKEDEEAKKVTITNMEKLSEKLEKKITETENQKEKKKLGKELKKLKEDYIPRMEKYEKHLNIMGNERNSYSRTDHDATFMRMKEDHMRNGQLKPAYNTQIATQNQIIVGYDVSQDRNDVNRLEPVIENIKDNLGITPKSICADSGYGNEKNYKYLIDEGIESFVKYPYFHRESKKKYRENQYLAANLKYDENRDEYICPNSKRLKYIYTTHDKNKSDYISTYRVYECESCDNCEHRNRCHKSKYNRKINVNVTLDNYKAKMRKNLTSKKGLEARSKRPVEVEATFGEIKWNRNFKRFLLRGLDKVTLEWGLICLAHNFLKVANINKNRDKNIANSQVLKSVCSFFTKILEILQKNFSFA